MSPVFKALKLAAKNTARVLWQPFSFGKWLKLAFIAVMALSKGCGFPLLQKIAPFSDSDLNVSFNTFCSSNFCHSFASFFSATSAFILLMIAFAVILVFLLVLFWGFIKAVFTFIFVEAVDKSQVSIRTSFPLYLGKGLRYYVWKIIFNLILFALTFALLIPVLPYLKAFAIFNFNNLFSSSKQLMALAYILLVLSNCLLLVYVINRIIVDFAIPIMYTNNLGFLKSFFMALAILTKNIKGFLLYFIVRPGLDLGAGIVKGICGLVLLLFLILIIFIPGIIFFGLLGGLTNNFAAAILLALLLGVPLFILFSIFSGFILQCFILPITVYLRSYSLATLALWEPQLGLIASVIPKDYSLTGTESSDLASEESLAASVQETERDSSSEEQIITNDSAEDDAENNLSLNDKNEQTFSDDTSDEPEPPSYYP